MILENRQRTEINERNAADYLRANTLKYDGLTSAQVENAHKDPEFLRSLEISGYGAIHMAEDTSHQERLYVSMCHRHYTAVGMRETISAQERQAKWIQEEANRKLKEHGKFMHDEAESLGRVGGYQQGHQKGYEVGKATVKKPLIDLRGAGADFTGGFVDAFKWIGVVGVGLILVVVYMAYGKGKG
jgi:hypothetical protein